ncbi:MAG: phosphate ABC transporter permease PstA [Alphaproteobacteria bacterium]|nr:phosphate ABC transporter permease PstA [Alphaproteobacteria bacterium]
MTAAFLDSRDSGARRGGGPPLLRLQRQLATALGWGLTGLAFLLLAVAMVWILEVVFMRGADALKPQLFTTVTQGNGGGLLNAIEGTGVLSAGALLLAVPFGLASGIYVAEFPFSRWAMVIRFLSDILVGVPSIVLGYAGYVIMVVDLGWHFSVAAGCITLAMISLPYICRTTELALREVPMALREAGYAMGAGEGSVILRIALPQALPGVLTGILLALSISVGETAPLLYTAGWSNFMWNGHLTHSPIGYLTYAVWTFINEPFASANALAYAAAFLISGIVLAINVVARLVLRGRQAVRP